MSQDIDVNAFAENLNEKLDRDLKNSAFNMDLIIAYKAPTQDDPTWYRQYKSGWVEQGGKTEVMASNTITTITFPISMIDTNYTVTACERYDGGTSDSNNENYWISTLNVSSMGVYNSAGGYKQLYWEVKGFAANPEEGGEDESTYGNVYKTYFYRNTDLDYEHMVGPYTPSQMASYSIPGSGVIMGYVNPDNSNNGRLKINDHIVWGADYYYTSVYIPVKKNDVFSYVGIDDPTTSGQLWFVPYLEPSQSTDPSVTTLVDAMWPVGSIYIGTTVNCPLAAIIGTWEKIDGDLVLQSSSQAHQANTKINAGLPDHTHHIANYDANGSASGGGYIPATSFAVGSVIVNSGTNGESGNGNWSDRSGTGYSTVRQQMTKASDENPIYGNSDTVQPPAYVVNVWKRTA